MFEDLKERLMALNCEHCEDCEDGEDWDPFRKCRTCDGEGYLLCECSLPHRVVAHCFRCDNEQTDLRGWGDIQRNILCPDCDGWGCVFR